MFDFLIILQYNMRKLLQLFKRFSHTMFQKIMSKAISIEDSSAVSVAVKHLLNGDIIAVPTDTVYGLACDAMNASAIKKLYDVKGRSEHKPVAICVGNVNDLKHCANVKHLPQSVLTGLLPGPVTLILRCNKNLHKSVKPENCKVGIRIPNYNFIREVANCLGSPLALTSANFSNNPSCLSIDEFAPLWPHLAAVFDGGSLGNSEDQRAASTIVDLTVPAQFKVVRRGVAYNEVVCTLRKHGIVDDNSVKSDSEYTIIVTNELSRQ